MTSLLSRFRRLPASTRRDLGDLCRRAARLSLAGAEAALPVDAARRARMGAHNALEVLAIVTGERREER